MLSKTVLALVLVGLQRIDGAQDDDNFATNDDDSSMYSSDDYICVVVMSLFFAYLVSFLGSIFIYVAYLENGILNRYKKEGTVVEADVISTEFARGGKANGDVCFEAGRKEYSVVLEYVWVLPPANTYRVKVRKQIRVMETDFVHPHHPELNAPKSIDSPDPCALSRGSWSLAPMDSDVEKDKGIILVREKPKVILNQASFFQTFLVEQRKLELLVIDGLPKSGFPVRQMTRRLSCRRHAVSTLFVMLTVLCTLYSLNMALRTINELEVEGELQGTLANAFVVGCVLAILFQVPCIHLGMKGTIQRMLEDEYYESGELLQTAQDDSTLSSGSDVLLMHQLRSLDSGLTMP